MIRSEFAERFRQRRLSVGHEVAAAADQTRLARRHWQRSLRAAAQKALMGMLIVIVLVGLVMWGLWAFHTPEPHMSAYGCPYTDRANPWHECR